ncbi:MAG TPA: hypothetical protein VK200_16050, partial [Candidatus Limnocylindrales bacterium]|nr:hypothetical protein [Candidatus Limnocylindrales bacterium]
TCVAESDTAREGRLAGELDMNLIAGHACSPSTLGGIGEINRIRFIAAVPNANKVAPYGQRQVAQRFSV